MRLSRLDLLRYGHFSGRSLELPAGESDLHILFGPNEAGKSTTLAAIEDLLFGVPGRSPYGFLHDYNALRIGARLETGEDALEVVRRKGNKDTLLDREGTAFATGEAVLRPYLAGADRAFFERMFSLDHARLRQGGQEILEAKDDVGQMLFAAGSGIGGLRERLTALNEEADGLWAPRRAKGRRFYDAEDKRKEAETALREQVLTASRWQELKRARDEAEAAYDGIAAEIRERESALNRLGRIRRVLHNVRRKQEVEAVLVDLEGVVPLPENAGRLLAESEQEEGLAAVRKATLKEQLVQAEAELEGLTYDVALVGRAADIRAIAERRIEIRREKADLPKREADLDTAEAELRTNARELGWTESDTALLAARLPKSAAVRVVRELVTREGTVETEVANAAERVAEAEGTLADLRAELERLGDPLDITRLSAAISAQHKTGDLTGPLEAADLAFRAAESRVTSRLSTLNPKVIDEAVLVAMAAPAREAVQAHRERQHDWRRRSREQERISLTNRQQREAAEATVSRRVRDEGLITAEELRAARNRRDALWALLRVKHLEGGKVPEELMRSLEEIPSDLAAAFEPAMTQADALADHRFERAEAAGQVAEINRKIGELDTLLAQDAENEVRLDEEGRALTAAWTALWQDAPFAPLEADAMLDWLDGRAALLEAIEARNQAGTTCEALQRSVTEAKDSLLTELAALTADIAALRKDSLPVVIERAVEIQRRQQAQAEQKARLADLLNEAATALAQRQRQFAQAEAARAAWRDAWKKALAALGLSAETPSAAVEDALDTIGRLRKIEDRIIALRHDRIDKIKRDLDDFAKEVAMLVEALAPDLGDRDAEAAVLELEARLKRAEDLSKQHGKTSAVAGQRREQIAALEDEQRERAASLSHLQEQAGVESNEALKEAIALSDRLRSLGAERSAILARLHQDGDGLPPEALEAECAGASIDEIVAQTASVEAELAELRARENSAIEARTQARAGFEAVDDDGAAARAAADRQEALAEMGEVAGRYLKVKTSALLLQWAIDRYRREKQAPLLRRAGGFFHDLTGGSFAGLQVTYDSQDRASLAGERPDGGLVEVSGMSSGTADQLYLALRVAAIEDYLERASALPFVADDLFINFDDARAAAGLGLLQALSRKTQVLFFTHHRHLVALARTTLGASVKVVELVAEAD